MCRFNFTEWRSSYNLPTSWADWSFFFCLLSLLCMKKCNLGTIPIYLSLKSGELLIKRKLRTVKLKRRVFAIVFFNGCQLLPIISCFFTESGRKKNLNKTESFSSNNFRSKQLVFLSLFFLKWFTSKNLKMQSCYQLLLLVIMIICC